MIMKILAAMFIGMGSMVMLVGCETPEPGPTLPQSEESDMPWNTPRPGEGTAAFGGIFDNR